MKTQSQTSKMVARDFLGFASKRLATANCREFRC